MKFRKKPVIIDAAQLTWSTWSEVCDLVYPFPDGMKGVYVHPTDNGTWSDEAKWDNYRIGLLIPTLEGSVLAVQGDWIIRGLQGELYPCKPDIFDATYEPVV